MIQVTKQVSKILPRIEQSVNDQLEAEVLIRSSNEAKTSHAVGANLSELELKNILIDKMENNKSNDRSVQQKNLYKALVDAYEVDKGILDTYGDTVTLKRRRDDEDEDKEPSADRTVGWSNEKIRAWKKKPEPSTRLLYVLQCTKEKDFKSNWQEFDTGFTKDQLMLWHHISFLIGKLTNLNVEERLALGVSLRMFTRSIVIRRRVEDLQLGFESYQKKLNLTRPDTYRSDLKRMSTNTAYSNPRGFIYQNKDKKNRLMRIDELHKFSNGTLKDVRSALDDILKRIRMQYLPQTIWRNVDK
ncbi:hypothetical protein Tco_0227886 [Tanacetum coccineum]